MSSDNHIDLSIIIVNWNLKEVLSSCLDSVLSTRGMLKNEIIVVDNSSSDDSVVFIKNNYPAVTLIVMDSNVGFSAANNCGYRYSKGEFVLFLNPDTIVPEGSLEELITYMKENQSIGVLGPKLCGENGQLQISWGKDPNIITEFFQALNSRIFILRSRLGWGTARESCVTDVDWLSGAFMVVRREVLETTGVFDDRFVAYFEDCDLCRRIRDSGHRVVYYPFIHTYHLCGMARTQDRERVEWERRKGELFYYSKYNGKFQSFLLRGYLCIKFAFKVLLLTVRPMKKGNEGVRSAKKILLLMIRGSSN